MSTPSGIPAFGGLRPPGDGRRQGMPAPLATALVLLHTLFAFTVLGGLGVLLTAASLDVVDGRLLAQVAYAAAPGMLGWWLARRTWEGGARVWGSLIAVQAWLILGSISNITDGSARGFTQLVLPLLILFFLTRAESRAWYRLPKLDRAERRPFSLARMIRWRRDEGQTAVEYAGLIAVVAAIITALLVSGLGTQIYGGIESAVCKVTGTACPAPSDVGTGTTAGGGRDGKTDNADSSKPVTDGGGDQLADTSGDGEPQTTDGKNNNDDGSNKDDNGGDKKHKKDDGCFSGVGAFFGCAGDQVKQVGQGLFVDGIGGELKGMYDMVRHPMDTLKGLKDYGSSIADQWSKDSKDAADKWGKGHHLDALTDWGGATVNSGVKVLDDMFVGDEVRDQWNGGHKTRAVTAVLWNVGSLFIPGYGEAKIAEKLGKLGKLGKVAEKAAKAVEEAKKAAKAGDVRGAEKAAKEADEAADEAEKKARQSGCTLSAPARRTPYGGGTGHYGASGTGTTVFAAGTSSPYVVLAEDGCDEEAEGQAKDARENAAEADAEVRAAANKKFKKRAGKIVERAKAGTVRRAPNYHGRLPHDLEREILAGADGVYASTGTGGRLIFHKGGDIVIVEGQGARAGQVVTSYGPSGPRGESGAEIYGGTPEDPGKPITPEMIAEGKIPIPKGGFLAPGVELDL